MAEKLALDGGSPAIGEKLPGWPWFDEETIKAGGYEVTLGGHSYLDKNTGEIILEEIRKLLRG